MNQDIMAMAKQCGDWNGQTIEMNDVGLTKFAELIVLECANLFAVEYGNSGLSGHEAARVLKKHFGVGYER
jgi:hypothetical protein